MEMKLYKSPQIEKISLDNEISLALESSPPDGPSESYIIDPNILNKDIYKSSKC
jgi:hypothetical protein